MQGQKLCEDGDDDGDDDAPDLDRLRLQLQPSSVHVVDASLHLCGVLTAIGGVGGGARHLAASRVERLEDMLLRVNLSLQVLQRGEQSRQTNTDQYGPIRTARTGTDLRGPTRTDAQRRKPTRTDADRRGPTRTDADRRGPTRTDADRRGPTRTDTDRHGPTRTDADRYSPIYQTNINRPI